MIIVLIISYLIGSLNSAIIATFAVSGKDIRDYGSKNAGLTNVYRCFGKAAAGLTLLIDICKGFLVVLLARLLFISSWFSYQDYDVVTVCSLAAVFAILGHVFPIFYKFHGGKGILIAGVCMLAIDPVVFLCEFVLFVLLVAITRYISVGSIACCFGYPLFTFIWQSVSNAYFGGVYECILVHTLIALAAGILCFWRHMPNVKRLMSHTESKFSFKK